MKNPRPHGEKWKARTDVTSSLYDLFDVKFTNIVQCDTDDYADELPNHFPVGPGEDMSASLGSKVVIDLDGNGFSGRFYRVLRTTRLPELPPRLFPLCFRSSRNVFGLLRYIARPYVHRILKRITISYYTYSFVIPLKVTLATK